MGDMMFRDAKRRIVPQILTENGYSVLANGDMTDIDIGKYKLLVDKRGDVLPYQYFDVNQMKFVPGTLGGNFDGELPDATTSVKGIVQLGNSLDNASVTKAATTAVVKQVDDKITTVVQQLGDLIPPDFEEAGANIIVKTQLEANNLLSSIRNVNSQIINVAFRGGRYFIDQLSLSNEFNNKEINFYNFSGEEVEIFPYSDVYKPSDAIETTPTHYICELKNPYLGQDSLITNNGRIRVCDSRRLMSNGIHYNAQDNVETVDTTNKIYRLKLPDDLLFLEEKELETNARLYLWSSYSMFGSKATKVEDGYIYFTQTYNANVNLDFSYLGKRARFYVTNVEEFLTDDTFMVKNGKVYIPRTCKYAIIGNKNNCFDIRNSTANINFNGLTFSGGYYNLNYHNDSAINMYNTQSVSFENCNFVNLDSQAVVIFGTGNGSTVPLACKNINFKKCKFNDLGAGGIEFLGEDISVTECTFKNIGILRMGCAVIRPSGVNFKISDNYLYEFPYNGIHVGNTRNEADYNIGVVERNILHCDPKKNRSYDMADGGAIYVFTHNVNVRVKDNVIFNIFGDEMRGIMGDDGNNNTTYERNLVFNIFGEPTNTGIIAANPHETSTKNHINNIFKNNIVIGNRIAYRTLPNSNTREDLNVITHALSASGGHGVTINPSVWVRDYRLEENAIVLDNDFVFPFEIPEIFEPYIKYEDLSLNVKNRGRRPILLNNTDAELNIGNQVVTSNSQMYKYDQLSMNLQMVRGYSSSPLGQYSSMKIQLPWNLGSMVDACFINFKVNIFSERATYRNSFEVTMNTHKADVSTYGNIAFDISRVSPKTNAIECQLKITAYIDAGGFFSLLIEPLIAGESFISNMLFFIELFDVKVYKNNDLTGEKGVISINETIPNGARTFGAYAILSTKATRAHLHLDGVTYPDSQVVHLTDTNQVVVRKNNRWYTLYVLNDSTVIRWVSYGDSITQANNWQPKVASYFVLSNVPRGVGGVTVANNTGNPDDASNTGQYFCNINRINAIPTNANIITIMGGTNDMGQSIPIGDLSYPFDATTFKGGLALTITRIQAHVPNAKIVLMTPLSGRGTIAGQNMTEQVKNHLNLTTEDYAKAIKEVGNALGIPVIDVFAETGINQFNRASYITDTVHPNQSGADKIANVVINGLKRIIF